MSHKAWALRALVFPVGLGLGAACSASSGQTSDPGLGPGVAGTSFGGAPGGGTTSGGGDTSLGGDTSFGGGLMGHPLTGGGGIDGGACTSNTYSGERLPLDMYFVIDQSGSMNEKTGGGNTTKWQAVTTSLTAFLNDPANADVAVGSEYFPFVPPGVPAFCCVDSDCGQYGPCVGGSAPILTCQHPFGNCQQADACQPADYKPAVPLQLPPNHGAVVSDMANHGPGGGTPTTPALTEAVTYVTQWIQANPGRKTVIVLATDGDPTGCTGNSVQDIANVAAGALASPQKIQTFVIGVGSSLTSLNAIAQAGGTGQAYIVDTGGNVQQQFSAALAAIHGAALPCNFSIPTNGQADPNNVNITYTTTGSPTPLVVPRVAGDGTDKNQCPTNSPAWYYNDAGKTAAVLCDATCANLKTLSATVSFVVGCPAVIAPPPH